MLMYYFIYFHFFCFVYVCGESALTLVLFLIAGEDFDKHLREDDGMQRNQEDDYAKDENESKV